MKTELRLGNHVYISPKDSPDWLIPSILNTGNFIAILRDLTVATPVPLTPELLLKVGFTLNTVKMPLVNWEDYRLGNMVINKTEKNFEVEFGSNIFDIEERTHIAAINYVHQLQNLYFALTSEELNIEL